MVDAVLLACVDELSLHLCVCLSGISVLASFAAAAFTSMHPCNTGSNCAVSVAQRYRLCLVPWRLCVVMCAGCHG